MSQQPRVVVADPMHADGIAMLSDRHPTEVFGPDQKPACLQALQGAQAVVVRTFVVDADLISRSPELKVIVKHGAGLDNIDILAATARGIVVANTGDANAESVAEAAVSLMFAAARRTVPLHRAVTGGNYGVRWGLLVEGICGKTLGLVGFGNIGRRVAAMCRNGFRMEIVAFDPFLTAEQMATAGARKAETLDELLQTADVVSLHVSLEHGGQPLIGARELALMKPSAILINTARGGVVDEQALAEALTSKRLYGAGLDVLEKEPPDPDNPLFRIESAVLAPHVGGATESARRLMSVRSAQAVLAALDGQRPEFIARAKPVDHQAGSLA